VLWSFLIDTNLKDLDASCALALQAQVAGRSADAEAAYLGILHAAPAHGGANHCLGMLKIQLGDPAAAIPYLYRALTADLSSTDYWLGYLEGLLQAGQIEQAGAALILARKQGLAGTAADQFAARLTRSRKPTRSEPSATDPTLDDSAIVELLHRGETADAVALARAHVERHPQHGVAWKILGAALWGSGVVEESLRAMRIATDLLPQDAEAHTNLGTALCKLQRIDEAEHYLTRARSIDPSFRPVLFQLGAVYGAQARYRESEQVLRQALASSVGPPSREEAEGHSNLLFLLANDAETGPAALLAEHLRFGARFGSDRGSAPRRHANTRDPDRPLRIGFLSGDFYRHSVANFSEPAFACLANSAQSEVVAYYNNTVEDEITARLRAHCRQWRVVNALSDRDLASAIVRDRIDILVDLSGHTGVNRLPAMGMQAAPIQVSWLGYPATTGLAEVQYYLADAHWLPPGHFDAQFVEKLVYLPSRWAYLPVAGAPDAAPLPALGSSAFTFGSFHRMTKINASTIAAWSALLRAVPRSQLLVAGVYFAYQERAMVEQFGRHGVAEGRILFKPRCGLIEYLQLHALVDLCLDTQPYAGATTTMHSAWMGLPTLTVAGATAPARAGAGILGGLGLPGFIAKDENDFVARGVYWSQHRDELASIRADLRSRVQRAPVGQPDLIVAHLERAFRHMWRRWCANLPPVSFATEE